MKNKDTFRELMLRVYDEMNDGVREDVGDAEYDRRRESFAFHMSDWQDDIATLIRIQKECGTLDPNEAARLIAGFLYHVIPHITEAGNLLLDEVKNPFTPVPPEQTA